MPHYISCAKLTIKWGEMHKWLSKELESLKQRKFLYTSIVFFVVLVGIAEFFAYSFIDYKHQAHRRALTQDKRIDALIAANTEFRKTLVDQLEHINFIKDQNAAAGIQLGQLREDITTLRNRANVQEQQIDLLLEIQANLEDSSTSFSKIFSYYRTNGWESERSALLEMKIRLREQFGETLNDPMRIMVDGGGGRDTFDYASGGVIAIDGLFFKSVENYELFNGEKNDILLTLPGLAILENNTLDINGDKDVDHVLLDGCLKWTDGGVKEDVKILTALDESGEKRTVRLSKNLPYKIQDACSGNYIQKAKQRIFQTALSLKKLEPEIDHVSHSQDVQRPSEILNAQQVTEPYVPNDAENIVNYEASILAINSEKVKSGYGLLLNAMKVGKFPTHILSHMQVSESRSFALLPVFNFRQMEIMNAMDEKSCGYGSANIYVFSEPGAESIKCAWGDQSFFLTDGANRLDDSWGDDIVFPGKGEDTLDVGWGSDIIVLEKGWGKKTISKTCSFSSGQDAEIRLLKSTSAPGGLGVQMRKRDKDVFVFGLVPGSAAEKAGLKKGDSILTANGRSLAHITVQETMDILRGPVGTPITISYRDYETGSLKELTLMRSLINNQNLSQENLSIENTKPIQYVWPYQYTNFIVFGSGIVPADIIQDGNKYTNSVTGDEIIVQGDCFNFIYTQN